MMAPRGKSTQRVCRCEAHIAPAVLEGYACGNPDCWRTAQVQASFAAFVDKLVAERGDRPEGVGTASPTG